MTEVYTVTVTSHLRYERALHEGPQWWRAVVAVLLGLVALGVVLGLAVPFGAVVDTALGRTPVGFADFQLTPGTWLGGALLVAALIPLVMGVQWVVYRVPAGSLASVTGRFRWRWAGRSAVIIVPAFLVAAVVFNGVDPGGWQLSAVPIAAIALVMTPLQSAGEEFLFRGLISRALAAPWARPLTAVLVSAAGSSVFFWLGHGAIAPISIVYYLAAGFGLWLTAHWTGGLEAGALMHACANTFLLVPAILAGHLDATTASPGLVLLAPAALWLVMPFILRVWAQRSKVPTTT